MKFSDAFFVLKDDFNGLGRDLLADIFDEDENAHSEIMDATEADLSHEIKEYEKIYNKDKDMNNLELLEKVTEAATFLYVKNMGDTVSPNIIISKLPNKTYYVSLNRYNIPLDRYQKTIVYKTTRNTLDEALRDVGKYLSKQKVTKTNPLEELGKMFDEPAPVTMPPPGVNYYR